MPRPVEHHWLGIDLIKICIYTLYQFFFRFNAYAFEHLLGHFTEEGFHVVFGCPERTAFGFRAFPAPGKAPLRLDEILLEPAPVFRRSDDVPVGISEEVLDVHVDTDGFPGLRRILYKRDRAAKLDGNIVPADLINGYRDSPEPHVRSVIHEELYAVGRAGNLNFAKYRELEMMPVDQLHVAGIEPLCLFGIMRARLVGTII